jgi:anaerobic sulfite reductase subunit B
VEYAGDVKPGQFFEVSIPKYGEAPISVSGIGNGTIDLTIRKMGRVTSEVFEKGPESSLFMRGPYGNGFDLARLACDELFIIAGGTGLSPVRPLIEHYVAHPGEAPNLTLVVSFKSPEEVLFRADFDVWEKTPGFAIKFGIRASLPGLPVKDAKTAKAVVVGPPPMMKTTVQTLLEKGFAEQNIWLSYERKMCCGLGKCGHCKINSTYVCLDGPVFNYTQAKNFVD